MFLLIDKPKGITSHDVIDRLRRIAGIKKIGHAGTLDPNATGLLIVGIGRESTKKLGDITKNTTKTYEAEITLGEQRDTDDSEGSVVASSDQKVDIDIIKNSLEKFVGKQMQIPPQYSAIKKDGKKAYVQARKGIEIKMEEREVVIQLIKLDKFKYPKLNIIIKVSSGTYIRALARDIGIKLGTYGYLSNLRRTKIGKYRINSAHKLEEINKNNWESYTIDI